MCMIRLRNLTNLGIPNDILLRTLILLLQPSIYPLVYGYSNEFRISGSVKNVGVEDTPRISEPLSFFEKTLFSSAPTGVSHR